MAGIDCFVLDQGEFTPRSRLKPGQKFNRAPKGWFAFEPPRENKAASIFKELQSREVAGAQGRVVRRGDKLVFAKTGRAVRFWGTTAGASVWRQPRADVDRLAERLSRMGINMVRFHVAPFYETSPGANTQAIHYMVSALKKRGIYSGLSWYCLAGDRVQPSWNLEGFQTGEAPMSLHLFYQPLQKLYRQWATTLLGTNNPHTGVSLARDSSVAYLELVDEDNAFFWTFNPAEMNPRARVALEKRYGAWLTKKYGSLEKAFTQWGPEHQPKGGTDDAVAGRAGLYGASNFGNADWQKNQTNAVRLEDQLRFLVQLQREFYTETRGWLKRDLGYDGTIVGTNWKTVDDRVVGPLDFYANMAADITARNTYFGGPHHRQQFFPWMRSDTYQDMSALREPVQAMMMHMQYADYPHFITEGGYSMPNRFRTEEQLLMSAVASLQGIDGMFPFIVEPEWNLTMQVWPIQTAATLGQYPAASLIYRRGDLQEGPVVIRESLPLNDLFKLKGSALPQTFGNDSNRLQEIPVAARAGQAMSSAFDPLSFYVGRVQQSIGNKPASGHVSPNLQNYIQRSAQTVKSATQQVMLDYGRGILTVNAPRAQGVTGFLEGRAITTADAVFNLKNPYGAAILVSLDGAPLKTSRRILLQVMSEEQNYQWTTKDVQATFDNGPKVRAKEIVDMGGPPLVVKNLEGKIALRRKDASRLLVTPLTLDGVPQHNLASRDARSLKLRPSILYYLITP
jgi:hypothetical protein